ncbi:S41 family peptidase [Hyphobacterium sp.]|uniref:S41 family peptidase n=1 Tax=Hyphobacterium sp. TaxID=2004662 RepID=UPI00374A146E
MFSKTILVSALSLAFLVVPARAQDNPSVDDAARSRVVEGVARQVEENFYDSGIGAELAADLRARLAAGEFDAAGNASRLAEQLTAILHPRDTHFAVRYMGAPPPGGGQGPQGPQGDPLAAARRANFGFNEVAVLPGNVGYIDMRQFYPAQIGGDTALAALEFIENTDAVIFDMRQNRGGAPSMVQLLISHFLDPASQVPINTFLASNREYPGEMISLAYLPGDARPDVPLYVLTSARTGSAGEAFPYHLQAMDRATIIGETTYGAGNPGGFFPAGEGFAVFVSTSRTRNPVTGTNWEGVGVIPDVDVAADDALDTALVLAYEAILENVEYPGHRQLLEWSQEEIEARMNPASLDETAARDVAGSYGERHIDYVDGNLFYRRGDRSGQRMYPLGEDRFMIEGVDGYRLTVQREQGRIVSLTLQQAGGRPRVSIRD